MEGVKEQRVDHQGTFHSATTGQVIHGTEIPPGGLQQDMLDPQVTMCASDVFLAPGNQDDDIQHQVTFMFYETLQSTNMCSVSWRLRTARVPRWRRPRLVAAGR